MSLAFVVSGSIARVLEKGFPLLIFMLRNRLPLDRRVNSIGGPITSNRVIVDLSPLLTDEVTFSTFAKFIPSTRSRISIHESTSSKEMRIFTVFLPTINKSLHCLRTARIAL